MAPSRRIYPRPRKVIVPYWRGKDVPVSSLSWAERARLADISARQMESRRKARQKRGEG